MEPFYPAATQIIFQGNTGGPYVNAPFRGVLHTTESVDFTPSTTNYYGHSNPPHFTLARKSGQGRVFQHYSIRVAARALANLEGGVQTNRQCAIQIEIAWRAANIQNLPQTMKDALRDLIRWINSECNVTRAHPTFYGSEAYGNGSIARMSASQWNGFNGWCGHQHVPENQHWDPGPIDIGYLLS
jgi:hypothetical protein